MEIYNYHHLKKEEIRGYLSMDITEFTNLINNYKAEINRENLKLIGVDDRRAFNLAPSTSNVYMVKDNSLFLVTPFGEQKCTLSEYKFLPTLTYLDEQSRLEELEDLLMYRQYAVTGGIEHCRHLFKVQSDRCSLCTATRQLTTQP